MDRALLIYSGGLDSTVLLYKLKKEYTDIFAVHFLYGSKHNKREQQAAIDICIEVDVPFLSVDIEKIGGFLESSLLENGGEIPDGYYTDESMKSTIVPFRNGTLLSIAAGIAVSKGYNQLYYGAHAGDHAIYPDCTTEFCRDMTKAIAIGTGYKVSLNAPFILLHKTDIVKLGTRLEVPFEKTWSCYKGGLTHCGTCGTCQERKEAFRLARLPDYTIYKGSEASNKKETNLCLDCINVNSFPLCMDKDIEFGEGFGNDNITKCSKYKQI